jgi:hypothetical protein
VSRFDLSIHPSIHPSKPLTPCVSIASTTDANGPKGSNEEAKGPVMRCTFDVAKLDCLKRHEEALRKRHEAVKRERHQEGASMWK